MEFPMSHVTLNKVRHGANILPMEGRRVKKIRYFKSLLSFAFSAMSATNLVYHGGLFYFVKGNSLTYILRHKEMQSYE